MPQAEEEIHDVVARNIRALVAERRRFERRKTTEQRVADAITSFTGSMRFVYLHAASAGGSSSTRASCPACARGMRSRS